MGSDTGAARDGTFFIFVKSEVFAIKMKLLIIVTGINLNET